MIRDRQSGTAGRPPLPFDGSVRGGRHDVLMDVLHVDCESCRARGPACADCVVSVLLGPMPAALELDDQEQTALQLMAASGMLPPLRLVRSEPPGLVAEVG